MVIGIAVGNIIEVAANDHRVWALVDLLPYAVALPVTFQESFPEFIDDAFGTLQVSFIFDAWVFDILSVIAAEPERLQVNVENAERIGTAYNIRILKDRIVIIGAITYRSAVDHGVF